MLRPQVEIILRTRHLDFVSRSGKTKAWDVLIPLGREESPVWYCSFVETQTLIEMEPSSVPVVHVGGDFTEQPTDVVERTQFEHQLGDCL